MKVFTEEFKSYVREKLLHFSFHLAIWAITLVAITILCSVDLVIDKIF